jgi:myosin heavy subunit
LAPFGVQRFGVQVHKFISNMHENQATGNSNARQIEELWKAMAKMKELDESQSEDDKNSEDSEDKEKQFTQLEKRIYELEHQISELQKAPKDTDLDQKNEVKTEQFAQIQAHIDNLFANLEPDMAEVDYEKVNKIVSEKLKQEMESFEVDLKTIHDTLEQKLDRNEFI